MKQLNSKIEALTYIRVGNENQLIRGLPKEL